MQAFPNPYFFKSPILFLLPLRFFGVGGVRAMQREDIAGHFQHLVFRQLALPGHHAFGRHTVFHRLENLVHVAAVQPVFIRQVRPYRTLPLLAVAGGSVGIEDRFA